jgi:hypothetical protein
MGLAIYLTIKTLDVEILLLNIEFETIVVEHNSLAE